jgi:hypothetical protein
MHVEREGVLPKKTVSEEPKGAANFDEGTELLAIIFDSTRYVYIHILSSIGVFHITR